MRRFVFATMILMTAGAMAAGQTSSQGDVRTFEVRPAAPPTPAMKYQLLFDDLADRRTGNAATLYLDSILLVGPDGKQNAQKALQAYDAGDMNTFASLADGLDKQPLFEELDLAGRREQCDWQPPFREMGIRTLLPHLEPLIHGVAAVVKVRALRQIEQGKTDDALITLRLGYELADKTGREPILISGLVSLGMTGMMNDCLIRLMSRPDSPNLYWALLDVPSRATILRNSFEGERGSAVATLPDLARVKAGEDLAPEQWRAILDYVSSIPVEGVTSQRKVDAIGGASPQVLREAQQHYARTHHRTAEQATKADPLVVLGSFYFRQYEVAFDEMFKLRDLPYPLLLARSREYSVHAARLQSENPANPFLQLLPTIDRAIWRFARADRQLAALTAVEALRAHAAAHGGALPNRLDDVTQTPVPQNPATGKPFEYRMQDNTATLSDSQSVEPLTYTIRIRK